MQPGTSAGRASRTSPKAKNRWRPMWRDSFIGRDVLERRPMARPTSSTTIQLVTHHGGGGSYQCFRYPVRLPRLSFLEAAHAA